jgi:hypothetical protein
MSRADSPGPHSRALAAAAGPVTASGKGRAVADGGSGVL